MAIIANQADSKFKLVLDAGVDANNKPIVKNKTFANVKAATTNDNLFTIATSLAGLQSYGLKNIVRYEEYDLIQQ